MPDIPEDPTQSEWLVLDLLDKLNNLFDRAKKDLVKIIDPGEKKTSTKPLLQQQLDQVDNIFKTVNLNGKDIIGPHMSQSYEHGQMYAAIRLGHSEDDIQRATWKKVGGHVIEAQSNFKGLTDDVAKNVRRVIADGITTEQTVKQISKDIRDQVDTIGKNRADMIARTETMKAVNVGVKDKYRSAGIEVVRWLATIQPGRTCEECMALNGKPFPIDKTPPIPKHPRCRCTLSPVPDPDWSEVEGWDGEQVTPPKEKKKAEPKKEPKPKKAPKEKKPEPQVKEAPPSPERREAEPVTKNTFKMKKDARDKEVSKLYNENKLGNRYDIEARTDLTADEIDAVGTYQADGYKEINAKLRGIKPTEKSRFLEGNKKKIDAHIKKINSAIEKSPTPDGMPLYRGTGRNTALKLDTLKEGAILEDNAFISYSSDPNVALNFARNIKDTPGGTHRVMIRYVTGPQDKALSVSGFESEFITKGGKFKVAKVEMVKLNRIETVKVLNVVPA